MNYTQTHDLNLIPGGEMPVINVSHGDVGSRTIVFNLLNGRYSAAIPSGVTATCDGTKPDDHSFSVACTISDSSVRVPLTEQMTIISGDVLCQITLHDGNDVIGSANFILRVEGASVPAAADYSDSYSRTLEQMFAAERAYTDDGLADTLAEAKEYADSKATQALNDAKDYTDDGLGSTLQEAKDYTDAGLSAERQHCDDAVAAQKTIRLYDGVLPAVQAPQQTVVITSRIYPMSGIKDGDLVIATPDSADVGYGTVAVLSNVTYNNGAFVSATATPILELNLASFADVARCLPVTATVTYTDVGTGGALEGMSCDHTMQQLFSLLAAKRIVRVKLGGFMLNLAFYGNDVYSGHSIARFTHYYDNGSDVERAMVTFDRTADTITGVLYF